MINVQRVKMMTETQIFLDQEENDIRPMSEYYRSDYVAKQMLLSILSGTVVFVILCVLVFSDDIEKLLLTVDLENLTTALTPLLTRYLIFMVIYLVITFLLYAVRYGRGRKKVKKYYSQLTALEKQYKEEEQNTKPTGGLL